MTLRASCHCGANAFEADVEPEGVTRCTCTFCTKRGALWIYTTPDRFRLRTPRSALATYQWRTRTVKHHFCPTCGCTTFTESPDFSSGTADFDNPRIAINGCILDDVDVHALPVTVIDGRNLW